MLAFRVSHLVKPFFAASIVLFSLSASANEPMACIEPDSDPDGDRWGWENGQSCLVVARPAHPVCSDASLDPDNDGWGWENNATCRVASGGSTQVPVVDMNSTGLGLTADATDVGVQPPLAAHIVVPFHKYPNDLEVSSSGIIYFFQPPSGVLAAMDSAGNFLWERDLHRTLFIDDMKLDPTESQLVVSLNGGGVGSFDLQGNQQWVFNDSRYLAPEIHIGDTAIIASFTSSSFHDAPRVVASFGFDGSQRWNFASEDFIGEVAVGHGNVYIRATNADNRSLEEILVYRQ